MLLSNQAPVTISDAASPPKVKGCAQSTQSSSPTSRTDVVYCTIPLTIEVCTMPSPHHHTMFPVMCSCVDATAAPSFDRPAREVDTVMHESTTSVYLWTLGERRWLLWSGWVVLPLLIALVVAAVQWIPPLHQWPGSPSREGVRALLVRVHVIPHRHHILGYERACTGSSACSFGTAWTDDSDAPGGHNGIDTRSEMLRQLSSHSDPYTGEPLPYQRQQRHIDHIFPLAAAWDMGAAGWSQRKRVSFANDISRNLVVVAGDINREKGDSTPSEWLPPWKGSRCWYAARYLSVALYYGLSISQADWRALSAASRFCSPRKS